MASTLLSDAIERYIASRTGLMSKSTIANDRQTLTYFLTEVGNIQTKNLAVRHGEQFMVALANRNLQASTLAGHHARLGTFVGWLKASKYLGHWDDPLATTRRPKVARKIKMRVPMDDFPRLLDTAHTPRHRILTALGVYIFLRAGEVKVLRLDDVILSEHLIRIRQPKTKKEDEMPICAELGDEIRRWMTWYAVHAPRELLDTDYLVPSLQPARVQDETTHRFVAAFGTLVPEKPVNRPSSLIQQVLRSAGYDVRDQWGNSLYEGCHTLRRSGARALYDHLVDDRGYDGALRTVQAMLHHETTAQTEEYLGLDLDIKKRDKLLRGESMFGTDRTAEVRLLGVGI